MTPPFVEGLSTELENISWSFCQLHMRSSYMGYGTGSLQRDFEDIGSAVAYLRTIGKKTVVLMGHSTGSQDSIYYALNHRGDNPSSSIDGVIVLSFSQRPILMDPVASTGQ
jgi:pimeloyl-ACP methyl ester carboxylesterase